MSESVRVRESDHEAIKAIQEVLGLPTPEILHLSMNTDVMKGSPTQNARRALKFYYACILEQYDQPSEVPVEEKTFENAEQAIAALTVGAEKHKLRQAGGRDSVA